MITSIDFKKKQFTYLHDTVETTVLFSDVEASEAWVKNKVIRFEHLDSIGRKCGTTLARNAFIDNIAFNNRELRGDELYDLDKNIFLLYRFLDGETLANAKAEVENIEVQRAALDERKAEYKAMVDQIIVDHVALEDANAEIKAHKAKVEQLGNKILSTTNEEEKAELTIELAANVELGIHLREEAEIPVRPEIPPMDFSISKEMQKLVRLALDPEKPEVTLKNVSLEHLK